MVVVSLLLVAAIGWVLFAEVGIWVTSLEARVESAAGGHPVDAEVDGTVVEARTRVGERVETGEVLVELDPRLLRLQIEEERSTAEALEERIAALGQRLATERAALRTVEREQAAELDEERARLDVARARLALAASEARRAAELHEEGLLSDAELERAESDENQQRAAASASDLALARLEWEHRDERSERRGRIETLEEDLAERRGDLERVRAKIQRLEREVARYSVRAPVSGVVAEHEALRPGETVSAGERVATVVPDGELRIVARFAPSDVLGRLRPGQSSVVRLHGFPWTQYGTVPAVVARVASEVRDGRVEVELRPTSDPGQGPPLSHGLPGTVEVRVETVSPLTLALRAAGGAGPAGDGTAVRRSGV